jgi:hypothetical protein
MQVVLVRFCVCVSPMYELIGTLFPFLSLLAQTKEAGKSEAELPSDHGIFTEPL